MPLLVLAVVASSHLASGSISAEIRFQRVDKNWGVDFVHQSGASGRYYMVESNGGGVLLFDYDDDGDLDLLLCNGGSLPGHEGEGGSTRLYENRSPSNPAQGTRFVDVTDRAGLASAGRGVTEAGPASNQDKIGKDARAENDGHEENDGHGEQGSSADNYGLGDYGSGAAAADVDGDGDLDLFLSAYGLSKLWMNRGDGRFEEAPSNASPWLGEPGWATAVAFADVDRDGDLDLYLTRYVHASLNDNKACGDPTRGLRGYCGPDVYRPMPDFFYRNRGDGSFEDATAAAGFAGPTDKPHRGAGLAAAFGDLDGDGWQDLYVANDLMPNFLFHNRGDGSFVERGLLSGTALGDRGQGEASMGIVLEDLDGDLRSDLVVTHYEGETHALYSNRGDLLFLDRRFVSGLAEPSLRHLAFGIGAGDLDLDGDLDLVVANGHVRENADQFNPASSYRQPNQIFEGVGNGRFRERPQAGLDGLGASRGLALGDLDGDGDLDLVISNVGEGVEIYENVSTPRGKWLQLDLRQPAGNRMAVGAQVELHAGGRKQVREARAGSSFMSQHDRLLHFGLGTAERADRIRIRWPDGTVQTLGPIVANQRLVVRQSTGSAANADGGIAAEERPGSPPPS